MAHSSSPQNPPISLLHDDHQFVTRLLSRDLSNLGDSGHIGYKSSAAAAGAVPFHWEAEPGKPKSEFSGPLVPDLPPLSLPPIRHAGIPSSPNSASLSPMSIADKMKSLILNGKFSGPLSCSSSSSSSSGSAEQSFHNSLSKSSRRGRRSHGSSDGSAHQPSFNSTSNGPLPSKKLCKGVDDNSPTSTLDYNSDRYSPTSSPLYYSPLYSSTSPSVGQDSALFSPSDPASQSSVESVYSSVPTTSINSPARPGFPGNCHLSAASFSNSGPLKQNRNAVESSRHSSYHPARFYRDHPELLSELSSRGALSKSLSSTRSPFCNESMFHSGPQIGHRSVSFNPGMRDPTCNSLDKLFPLKSSQLFLSGNQQSTPEIKRSLAEARESFAVPSVDSLKVSRNDGRTITDTPAEELIKIRGDGNAFAYRPVASAFVFADRGSSDQTDLSSPRQCPSKRNAQPELKSILKKSRSTGEYSHQPIPSENDQSDESQEQQLGSTGSQKISSVLLRFAEAEEKLFNSRRQAAKEDSGFRGASCLPVCSFLGRAFLCRSKFTTSRSPHV